MTINIKELEDTELKNLITEYYTKYYRSQLGLPDWKERIHLRLNEEQNYCEKYIALIEQWFSYDFNSKKVLIVGCGTGGELINFFRRGADAYGIDPSSEALKISQKKLELHGLPIKNVRNAFSEDLPYKDNEFDFIYCFTVIEHVTDIKKSLSEMVRCVKNKGKIFIETPDYRNCYEGHYKLPLPMFLPKWFNKIILIILGRPSEFLKTINKVNTRIMQKFFNDLPVTSFKIDKDNPRKLPKRKLNFSYLSELINFMNYKLFLIPKNQIWILEKRQND